MFGKDLILLISNIIIFISRQHFQVEMFNFGEELASITILLFSGLIDIMND